MITIYYCTDCGTQFLIPKEYTDGLDTTFFACPECTSKHWKKLSDSPIVKENLKKSKSPEEISKMKLQLQ
jgi:DNA-directed RNA polymerase subunit RPC12/RpoP